METDSQQLGAAVSAPGRGLDSLAFACTTIVVADLDRSSQWYESVLGFTETRARQD
jgi:catechol-2,3-dioxygenase